MLQILLMQNLSCMEEATECFPVRTYVWVLYCSSCYPQLIWYLRRTYTYLDNLSCYDGNTKSPIRNMRSIKLAASVPNLKSSTADSYIVALQHTDSRGEFVDPRRKRKWKKNEKRNGNCLSPSRVLRPLLFYADDITSPFPASTATFRMDAQNSD